MGRRKAAQQESPQEVAAGQAQAREFDSLVGELRSVLAGLSDKRQGSNKQYSMEDLGLSAFSVFFMQCPSFLAYQRMMQESHGGNNARTLFQVVNIPSDAQIRNVLDEVEPSEVFPVFQRIWDTLESSKSLDAFRRPALGGDLLLALDGTQFFSSENISCQHCSTTRHKNGKVTYSHSVLTPVLVAPGLDKVLPMEPEFIAAQDGAEKQDCEHAAAKRWIENHGADYARQKTTILGDDLYCCQPICRLFLENGLNFVLTCKPSSHTVLFELIDELDASGGLERITVKRKKGKFFEFDTYRFINQVPLRGGIDAIDVNWCEIVTTKADGSVVYKNSFATNHSVSKNNVAEVVAAGRARWKIENENNNTLKTKGYNLEHNFGHGKNHLSMLLVTLNLLAFLFHSALALLDEKYQLIRNKLRSRKTFFNDIRALTTYMLFNSWNHLLLFMLDGLDRKHPP